MRKITQKLLIEAALRARQMAVAPYSRFQVGAALLTPDGRVILGANVESASYGLTCCAERVALFKALTDGDHEFEAIAVVARAPRGATPCGACRQLLAEYAPDAIVWLADSARPGIVREYSVAQLIPDAFSKFRPGRPSGGSPAAATEPRRRRRRPTTTRSR
jgi:cytidine deaminase